MLTEFYFDENFLGSDCFNDNTLSIAHDSFLDSWSRYGVLILPANLCREEFAKSINLLPPKFRKKWFTAFERFKTHKVEHKWNRLSEFSTFEDILKLSIYFKTAFVEDTLGEVVCEGDDSIQCDSITGFEVISAGMMSRSNNFIKSKILSECDIPAGVNVSKLWESTFHLLAKYNKRIYIVDRYFFNSICEDINNAKSNTAFSKLANYLQRSGQCHSITIFSYGDEDMSNMSQELRKYFNSFLKSNSKYQACLSRVSLISVKESVFKSSNEAHDRHFRFENYVCQIGVGMKIFDSYKNGITTFTIKDIGLTQAKRIEQECRDSCLWKEVIGMQ